jgi:hypothetical protein
MSIFQFCHKEALSIVRDTVLAVKPHQVSDIEPERAWPCLPTYPCKGNGDAIITLDNGTSMRVSCDSVGMGALMWFFKCGTDHFTTTSLRVICGRISLANAVRKMRNERLLQ